MTATPHILCSPYLRRPLRTLDQALNDCQARRALEREIWYRFDLGTPPQPESSDAGFPNDVPLNRS